ncbi:MAG: site-2 protease family protein [Methanosphaera sp.]|nr:site-2 protease family protein [Methanosphaera sp.]
MNALWYYAIGFVIVWVLAFLLKGKYNITIEGFMLMLKTDKLYNIIDKIAKISPRFWRTYLDMGIPLGIFFMILMFVLMIYSLHIMFDTPTVALILPGVDIPGSPIYIPFATGLLALATVLVIHEGGHGILARVEGIKIDSVGLVLFAIIPGAFVEPNEDELKQLNGISKLRIYTAGPMFNMGLAAIALVVMMCIGGFIASENFYTTDGMEISSVVPASPAEGILSEGMIITGINNKTVTGLKSYSEVLSTTKIGDNVTLTTDKGTYSVITGQNPNNASKSYIGIRAQAHTIVAPEAKSKYGTFVPWLLSELRELFYLIFLLNFSVGTFNLLPMKPLDGGLILEELLGYRITSSRRKDFNNVLNKYTRFLPGSIRSWISRVFNTFLNFLHNHELEESKVNFIVRCVSTFLILLLIMLFVAGLGPAILSMI